MPHNGGASEAQWESNAWREWFLEGSKLTPHSKLSTTHPANCACCIGQIIPCPGLVKAKGKQVLQYLDNLYPVAIRSLYKRLPEVNLSIFVEV